MDRNSKKAWLYLLPSLVLLGAFLVYPLIDVLVYSGRSATTSPPRPTRG